MKKVLLLAILLLIIALFNMPYGYYQLLRLVVCLVSGLTTYKLYQSYQTISLAVILFGLITLIYNPFYPLHFSRYTWEIINLVTVGVFVFGLSNKRLNAF